MRIYSLDEYLDELIADGDFQVEVIGEDCAWTWKVSLRTYSQALGRYVYEELASGTNPSFLSAYDMVASIMVYGGHE